jgi:hypothetical protein
MDRRWRIVKREADLVRYAHVVRYGWESAIKHSVWLAARAAVRDASSRSTAFARRRRGRSMAALVSVANKEEAAKESGFAPGERGTLEIGSGVVLGALGIGLQLGRWPAWTALVAVGGYLTWVVVYSEATVQTRRWRSGQRALPLPFTPSPKASPAPAQE